MMLCDGMCIRIYIYILHVYIYIYSIIYTDQLQWRHHTTTSRFFLVLCEESSPKMATIWAGEYIYIYT